MPKVDFGAQRKQAEQAGMLGGGFLKLKEGDNRLRLMSECLPHISWFDGKKNFKWLCYVLDRADGEVKAFFMPHKIYKAIEALQLNPDYQFFDVPMPYDLTIRAVKAGTINVEYSLIPARKETELTQGEMEKFDAVTPLEELKDTLNEKQEKSGAQPTTQAPVEPVGSELTDDDIPF
jgi:hypothetical protein